MDVYKAGSLEITVADNGKRLHLRCFSKHNSEEFKEGLVEALHYAEAHQIKQWVLDLREIGELDEEEEAWLHRYLFPSMMKKLSTGNYVAMVLSQVCYYRIFSQAGKYGLESYSEVIMVKLFCELQDAERWLDSKAAEQVP